MASGSGGDAKMAELSKNVQKLRFMQKATEDKDRKELEKRQLKAVARARWVMPGMEEEAKDTQNVETDVHKASTLPPPIMGRRSYLGYNPTVEQFMRTISTKKASIQQQREEQEDLMALHAMGSKRQKNH